MSEINNEKEVKGPTPVDFKVRPPISGVLSGSRMIGGTNYVMNGFSISILGEPGLGPGDLLATGFKQKDPVMIGSGLHGNVAVVVTALMQKIGELEERIALLEYGAPSSGLHGR